MGSYNNLNSQNCSSVPMVSLEPGEHSVRGASGNVTLIITRRGNIRTAFTLHLTSDALDSVREVNFFPGGVREEVVIPIVTELLPVATKIVTVVLSNPGNERIILLNTQANITILEGM